MVIGCCGAGKSTFSKQLHEVIKLPLIHLDQEYWKPNWTESESDEWEAKVEQLANKEQWIMDGNFGGTMEIRMKQADTIIFMDFPAWRCLSRVIKRIIKYNGQVRPDMPEGCAERFDMDFLHYVATFNLIKRPQIMKRLEKYGAGKEIIIFKNDRQKLRFLERLQV